ncbi:MAG: Cupredoxin-like protein [Bacteroidetes bacterium]|nr:Cupredoxin-like protein [Bacteroidota bacterium]
MRSMIRKFGITTFLILTVILYNGCTKEPKGEPASNEIWLEYKAFNPSTRSVAVGTTIVFINKDNSNHSATETTNLFDSGKISSGSSYSYTFNTAGTYYFYCNYHSTNSSEQGAIRVQ